MKSQRSLLAVAVGLGLAMAVLGVLSAATFGTVSANPGILYVSHNCAAITATNCYTSIQPAVNVALKGDIIRVAQGVYSETVALTKSVALEGGWNISFTAQDWNVYTTTLDAQQAGPVIRVEGHVSPTIEGFVITGGDATSSTVGGGGIQVYQSAFSPGATTIIRHNVITGNIACQATACFGRGGGISVNGSTALIEYNTIHGNIAKAGNGDGGNGGGLFVGSSSVVSLTGNTIAGNTALSAPPLGSVEGKGGGIYLYSSRVVVKDNHIDQNTGVYGGGIFVYSATGAISGNWIVGNSVITRGGGVYLYVNAAPVMDANWVLSNTSGGEAGGVCVRGDSLPVTLTNHMVAHNSAVRGGGVYVESSPVVHLANSHIAQNTADYGGGVYVKSSGGTMVRNWITGNLASVQGGGLFLHTSAAAMLDIAPSATDDFVMPDYAKVDISSDPAMSLTHNQITGNRAGYGGGLFVESTGGTIASNWITNNVAITRGGGIYLYANAAPTLDANRILSNTVMGGEGGGVCIRNDNAPVTWTNHIIAHNSATHDGGGVYIYSSPAVRLINNTVVDNNRGSGQEGVALLKDPGFSTRVLLTNNIIVGHSVAITVAPGCTATLSHNDYYNNTIAVSGQPQGATDLTQNPQFVNPAAGDYHLGATSPLIDAGDNSVNVRHDIDGHPRPIGAGYDLGANEYTGVDLSLSRKTASPQDAAAGNLVTFSIVLRNSGPFNAANVTLSDTAPVSTTYVPGSAHASSGTLTDTNGIAWAGAVLSGKAVTITFQVTIKASTLIENKAVVTDAYGTATPLTAWVNGKRIYLPLVMRNSLIQPASVQVYTTSITIPTYQYQHALITTTDPSDPIYPYPHLDFDLVGPKIPQTYQAVVLENAYVRVTLLPELGGRIYAWVDKTTGRAIAYSNPVIKPTPWGYRGWWLATGGMEWCLPTDEHGLNEYLPWQVSLGSTSVTVSDWERRTGLYVQVTLSLDEAHNYLTIQPRVANPTGSPQRFKFWLNAMLAFSGNRVSDATRFIVPTSQVEIHSTSDPGLPAAGSVINWPVYQGRDLSAIGNLNGWLGAFASPSASADFDGAYDPTADLGVVRVFTHTIARGVKVFTGRGIDPATWTDDGSTYFELWGGPSPTFADEATLDLGHAISWVERWYPVNGLGGVYHYANATAALRIEDRTDSVYARVAASANLINAQVKLWQNGSVVATWHVTFGPGQPATLVWQRTGGSGPLGLQLLDSAGNELAKTGTMGQ